MTGETQGCVGCHEPRTQTAGISTRKLMAMQRRPSRIQPIENVPEVRDYHRDVQPIWNRHCVSCHNAHKPEGRSYSRATAMSGFGKATTASPDIKNGVPALRSRLPRWSRNAV